MNRDNHMIMEAMHGRPEQIITSELHKVHTILNQLSTMIHLNRSSETDQLLSKIRDVAEMLMQDAPAENAEGNTGKKRLKYDYEWVTAFLPRDLDISNRAAQDKVLDLAFQETLKRLVPTHKNPRLAARNMFGDEDFPQEIISQYAWYQKHGFPDASEDGWYAVEDAEDAEGRSNAQHAAIAISLQKAGKKPA